MIKETFNYLLELSEQFEFHISVKHLVKESICQSVEYILELYIRIQIQKIQLLIFTEKFLPLPGFEPRTSPLPSRFATN